MSTLLCTLDTKQPGKFFVQECIYTIFLTGLHGFSDFNLATENLLTWLKEQIKKQQEDMGARGETGDVLIVLLGHSMGGLVCKHAALEEGTIVC